MRVAQQLEIRRAEPHEAGAIRALVRAAYAKWVPAIGREPRPMQADYVRALREHEIDLLCEGGRPLGLIETKRHEDHLWIENVAVDPAAQGRGLGRRLLAHAEAKAAAAGLGQLRLLTNQAFATNVALYQRLGYRIDRREPFQGGVTIYMSKRLEHRSG
ncbi:GNAT family N-acetyltransferase [Desertibaculum subflavum]|uniref:GNAT family N-acetyltransferase n=1 Tax=Desertibaculum subflavum TaxID=2268458 RepID=UPI000E672EA3